MEVTEVPKSAPVLDKIPAVQFHDALLSEMLSDRKGLEDVKFRVTKFIDDFKNKYSNLHPDTVETICQLFAGPWLLDESALTHGESNLGKPSLMERELSARLQHHFTQSIIHGSTEKASEPFQQNLYFLIKRFEENSDTPLGRTYKMSSFMNGIKAEISIIKTLLENGYQVEIPDWSKKSNLKEHKISQTMEWDVLSGIDIVTKSPTGQIFLIDAKGRYKNKDGSVRRDVNFENNRIINLERYPESLKKRVHEISDSNTKLDSIRALEIHIPTHPSELGNLGTRESGCNSYQDAFMQFGSLQSRHKTDILQALSI